MIDSNIDSLTEHEIENSFEAMLHESNMKPLRLSPGEKVNTKVVSISGDLVYVELDGKSEGVIPLTEFLDENGDVSIQKGDKIEAYFVSTQNGARKLTTLVNGYSIFKLKTISDAFKSGLPIQGEVKGEIKGGFEVLLSGVRAFCPASQIDLKSVKERDYSGKTFYFKVLEFSNDGRNIVVSRRVLLEEEKQAAINSLKETLSIGMDITAKVAAVQNFGVFVNLKGIEGLIPANEISWDRIDNPSEKISVGDEVTARIISIDWEKNRISLSIKATQTDPWLFAEAKYPVGSKINGTIVRLAPFGAFVNLEYGIDGLLHISNLGSGRKIKHPKEVVEIGQRIEAYVLSIDAANRKISLSMQPRQKPKELMLPAVGELLEGVVDKIMSFGVFVKINEELNGLIRNADMGTPPGSDHNRMFPVGTKIQAVVIEVDNVKGKVLLSRKEALDIAELEELSKYRESIKKEETSDSIGEFGKLLKAKLDEKK